jgi:hypothetical protein
MGARQAFIERVRGEGSRSGQTTRSKGQRCSIQLRTVVVVVVVVEEEEEEEEEELGRLSWRRVPRPAARG